jgi:hypothetical protein
MKTKYFFIILMLSLFTTSCEKDSINLFDKSPDERLAGKINEYYTILQEAPNGWIMTIETKEDGIYRLWMKFKAGNRVDMLCDMDATWNTKDATSTDIKESSYRIKAMQYPSLIFDTYNYIHLMADPQGSDANYGNINGGENGVGLASDFEFALSDCVNDKIELKGRYNSVAAFLEKATAAEETAIKEGALKNTHIRLSSYMSALKYPVVEINGSKVDLVIGNRTTQFSLLVDDALVINKYSSYPDLSSFTEGKTSSNIHFISPVELNGVTFSELMFDQNGYYLSDGTGNRYIYDNKKPSIPLRFGYNLDYTALRINDSQLQGTLVDPFLSNVFLAARAALATGGGRYMQYADLSFQLHPTSGEPVMVLVVRYNNTAGTNYNATWRYKYRTEANGNITFYEREQTGSSNERGREPYLTALVDYFCKLTYSYYSTSSWASSVISSITPVTFRVDWGENNTPGSSASIGALFPVNNEENFCCGILYK